MSPCLAASWFPSPRTLPGRRPILKLQSRLLGLVRVPGADDYLMARQGVPESQASSFRPGAAKKASISTSGQFSVPNPGVTFGFFEAATC